MIFNLNSKLNNAKGITLEFPLKIIAKTITNKVDFGNSDSKTLMHEQAAPIYDRGKKNQILEFFGVSGWFSFNKRKSIFFFRVKKYYLQISKSPPSEMAIVPA